MRWICWTALKKLSRYFSLVILKFLYLQFLAALKRMLGWKFNHLLKGIHVNMSHNK